MTQYAIVRGRHRFEAAKITGKKSLRCDVHKGHGRIELRELSIEDLVVDDESQVDFTFNEKWARQLALKWDDELCGVLDVVPTNGGTTLTAAERHQLKLGKDRERRNVKLIEVFLNELGAGQADACEIAATTTSCGYDIGKLAGGQPYTTIEAVGTLRQLYARGSEHLRKTLTLNTLWLNEPKTNTSIWLGAISRFVAAGYAEDLSAAQYAYLKEVVPGEAIRKARGLAQMAVNGKGEASGVAAVIEEDLRKRVRVRARRRGAAS